jgi:hypothetical protein
MIGEFSDLTITALDCILVERRHSLAAETGYWELDSRRDDGTTLPIEFTAGHFDLPHLPPGSRSSRPAAPGAVGSRFSGFAGGENGRGIGARAEPGFAMLAYGRGCLRLLVGSVPEPAMLHEGMAELV